MKRSPPHDAAPPRPPAGPRAKPAPPAGRDLGREAADSPHAIPLLPPRNDGS